MNMPFDQRLLATISILIQILLVVAVIVAAYFAVKKQLGKHCKIMKIAIAAQVLAILTFMLLPTINYIQYAKSASLFTAEILIHHLLGLVVIALTIVIYLISTNVMKFRHRQKFIMMLSFSLWLLTFAIGLHLYATIWLQP
jgi:uncharacterized membrane protein YozB (DUF420 family)